MRNENNFIFSSIWSPANRLYNSQMHDLHAFAQIQTTKIFVRNGKRNSRPLFVPMFSVLPLAQMFCLRAYPQCDSTDMRSRRPKHSTTILIKRTNISHRRPHQNCRQLNGKKETNYNLMKYNELLIVRDVSEFLLTDAQFKAACAQFSCCNGLKKKLLY